MDVVVEYLVKKKNKAVDYLIILGYIVGALVLFFFGTFLGTLSEYLSMVGVFIGVGAIYGAFRLITSRNIEYEYSIVNGEMDVDKIIAKRRRKRLLSLRLTGVEEIGKFEENRFASASFDSRIYCCEDPQKDNSYYMIFHHRDFGHALMVFTPSERMLDAIRVYIQKSKWQ